MKRLFYTVLPALAVCVLGVSCNKEVIENEGGGITVKVSLSEDATKSFTDAEGIKWEAGMQLNFAYEKKTTENKTTLLNFTSDPLTAAQISDDGYTASFTFPASLTSDNRVGWFYSTTCHADYKTRVEFTLGSKDNLAFTQDEAGIMNKRHIFLHSGTGTVNIAKGQIPELAMSVIGSIFRVIPYTSAHQDEQILSVTFSSQDYIAGTVEYDRKAGNYKGASTYSNTSTQSMTINLGTPFALKGVTDRNLSKGIYFALPATVANKPLKGYKWVVKTDKAEYTFDASDSKLEIKENVVKNIFLNLDKAVESRYPVVGFVSTHFYKSGLQLPASAGTDRNVWCRFSIDGEPATDFSIGLYKKSKFFCVSEENYNAGKYEEVVDWLTCSYYGDNWKMTYKANTTREQRVAYVIHRFPEEAEYSNYIFPDVPTQKVIQKAAE